MAHAASIHILDDDSLLHLFYLYRPTIFDGEESDYTHSVGGIGWDCERWWFKLTQVCRRWRRLIFGSASYLGLCLVCTYGTPVVDMLAHSPPFPLVIDYLGGDQDIAAEEDGIILALEQRDRVRRIRLNTPVPQLQKIIMAIDGEYPMLEYLIIPATEVKSTALILPGTFQAPHLRHLALRDIALPIGSRLLTTPFGIVTLCLSMGHQSAYIRPHTLLQWVSFMPQLDTLLIYSDHSIDRGLERQYTHALTSTHVTLPNIRLLEFQGGIAYMEALFCQIITPRLQKLVIHIPWHFTGSVAPLLQLMNTTENLRFDGAKVVFAREKIYVEVYPPEAEMYALSIHIYCRNLESQVFSVARIINLLGSRTSTVERLTIKHEVKGRSSEEYDKIDPTEWHKLLRSFGNVKTLHVDGLVKELSRSLRLDDGELPLELLPELQELTYSGSGNADGFTSFIVSRHNAGQPVTLMRHG
jgi:hypothetical protein